MNTTFSIRVDKEIKRKFLENSKQKGLDGSTLMRYFMEKFSQNLEIIQFNIDESFFDEVFKDPKIHKKLEKISDKLDTLGF